MQHIYVKIEKIKNSLYIKIPDLIIKSLHLANRGEIEISIHSDSSFPQEDLWGSMEKKVNQIDSIYINIAEDLHTLNMYNRIYIPEKFRFFFPPSNNNFYLITNVGQIKTHITLSGYFTKGIRSWVEINGPLEPTDLIHIKRIDIGNRVYEMQIKSQINDTK